MAALLQEDSHPLEIGLFQAEDQAEVKALILAGLADHWGFLDLTKNPDLNDITGSYVKAGATFLVARAAGRIVGTGALVPRSPQRAEIVRMSVDRALRRRKIGQRILQRLCERARADGYREIILETTETWTEVVAFYLHAGFRITHYQDGDVYFVLELTGES